jgi:excisionase family DNA binding protein
MSEQHEADPWLTYQQAAAIVGVHKNTLRAAVRRGDLQVMRVSYRLVRMRQSWLNDWLTRSDARFVGR